MNLQQASSKFAVALLALSAAVSAHAAQKICVFDIMGSNGYLFNLMKDYTIAMQRQGVSVELKAYINETIATEDFRTGQCDGLMATAFRTKQFNSVAAAIDSLGATSIVREGRVDIPSSYEVLRKLIQTYAARSPRVTKLMVDGDFEVGGIMPLGIAYPVVNDRRINTVEELAGKRIASFDYDKAQAVMIKRVGAQPVSADVMNFANKFNNGQLDMIAAPTLAYKPMELQKGIGTKGAMIRFPVMLLTYQLVVNHTKFPQGYGEKSREYLSTQFDRALQQIKVTDSDVPSATWMELSVENSYRYTLMLREARIDIAQQGLYDKRGLKVIKRVRCTVNPADPECSTKSEEDWK